ncbi:hypothetical protein L0244_38350, partial [bacterium]|nr:hypothetical protein [bacterium]
LQNPLFSDVEKNQNVLQPLVIAKRSPTMGKKLWAMVAVSHVKDIANPFIRNNVVPNGRRFLYKVGGAFDLDSAGSRRMPDS